jgi:hypothetical protein
LLAAVAPSAVAQAEVPAKKSDAIHEMSATFQELAKRVSPPIVEVMVTGNGAANVIHSLKLPAWTACEKAFNALKPGEAATMQVERNGQNTYVSFEME